MITTALLIPLTLGTLLETPAQVPVRAGTDAEQQLYAPPEKDVFTFVLFGDRTTAASDSVLVFKEGVRMANLLDPEFCMTVGDMVQGYNKGPEWLREVAEYRRMTKQLNAPWYPVVGNHDVYGHRGAPGGNLELYKQHFGPLYYSFDYKWAHFVCLFSDEKLSFGNPSVDQNMSAEQMGWLEKDLAATDAKQVYVFMHHPRWNYVGTNWPDVHGILARDGRVRAVFAGHLHNWTDDGVTDGIHYHTVGATGGSVGDLRETAHAQMLANVRVRPEGYSLALIPVGSLHGADMVLVAELGRMRELQRGEWVSVEGRAMVSTRGALSSELCITVRNPTDHPAGFRLLPEAREGWQLVPEETEGRLLPGREKRIALRTVAPEFAGAPPHASVQVSLDYLLESGLTQPIRVQVGLPIGIEEATRLASAKAPRNLALSVDGQSAVRVPIDGDFDALTLECWAKGELPEGWCGLVSKTQSSGFSLSWTDSGARGNVRLRNGSGYTRVDGKCTPERWSHYAYCWDGERARLYVDGKLAGEVDAQGSLHGNRLPLFVGADTNAKGAPEGHFRGSLDEVRVSTRVRYEKDFEPPLRHEPDADTLLLLHFDNELEGVFPDASGRHHHGWPVGAPKLVPRED